MVKNLVTLLLLSIFIFSCSKTTSKKKNIAHLSFTIKNYERNTIEVSEISDLAPLRTNTNQIQLEKNSDSTFTVNLNITEPTYFKIVRNHLYISPGDSIVASLDYNDGSKALYKGKGYEASKYLNDLPYPKAGSYLWSGSQVKSTIDSTIINIKSLAKKREHALAKVKNISSDFITLEKARIKADLINSYQSLYSYYPYINRIPEDKLEEINNRIQKATYNELKKLTKNFLNPSFLQLSAYQQIVHTILQYNEVSSSKKTEIEDWLQATKISYEIKTLGSNKKITAFFNENITNISTKKYKKQLHDLYTEYVSYGNGSTAKNFRAINTNGLSENLEQFKGKLIYLDLWATWCMPCLNEMPNFNKLVDRYANNNDIVFISLSIDNNLDEWRKNLSSREHKGLQWNTSVSSLGTYKINGVPRIIIIDKNFNIVAFNGPKPSSEETSKLIETNL